MSQKINDYTYLVALLMRRYGYADDNLGSLAAEQLIEIMDDYVINAGGYLNDL